MLGDEVEVGGLSGGGGGNGGAMVQCGVDCKRLMEW